MSYYETNSFFVGNRMGDQFVHMVFDADPLTDAPGLADLDMDARLELESRVSSSDLLHFVAFFAVNTLHK